MKDETQTQEDSLGESSSGLRSLYRHRFSDSDRRSKDAVWAVIVERYLQRWVNAQDVVLDIGCGQGEFLNHVRCGQRIGVDLNPDSADALAPGVEFHQQDVRDLSFQADTSVDVVFTSNLLEHLQSKGDVEALLSEALRVLKPGGHLIALGPNLRFLAGEYWDFWDHHTPLTERSLCEILETLGFEVQDCHPRFLPYTTRSSLPQAPWLVRLYLAVPLAWRVLGKQFLIRASRP